MRRMLTSSSLALSTEEDSLSQWRGYADDGMGYAIGFRPEALPEVSMFSPADLVNPDQLTENALSINMIQLFPFPRLLPSRVIYDESEQRQMINSILTEKRQDPSLDYHEGRALHFQLENFVPFCISNELLSKGVF